MTTTININVVPGREYQITYPGTLSIYYNGMLVAGTGLNNRFIALSGVTTLSVVSATAVSGNIVIKEYLRNFYDPNDKQGGVWSFNEKWLTQYGFRPEWFGSVANRLVTFVNGFPYIHNGSTNQFYGVRQDTQIALLHNEAGNETKIYTNASIEGNTPDIFHTRTETPNTQSSDIRGGVLNQQTTMAGEFSVREGVNYGSILRDRLSPNATGTYDQRLYTGDDMRGDIGKFQVAFFQPSTLKSWKFVNIGFIPSRGHNTQNK